VCTAELVASRGGFGSAADLTASILR